MIEIKHRTTGAVLYSSAAAENLRDAVIEAVGSGADLSEADLSEADLYGASLYGASLYGANLFEANLYGADLSNTVLDPSMPTNKHGDFKEIDGELVGYRTRKSMHCGNTVYADGETYRAEVFSVCPLTACHPGLYCYPRLHDVRFNYDGEEAIEVRFKRDDLHAAGGKYRVREFRVIGGGRMTRW